MDSAELISALGLEPHPEGGWYRETWRGEPGADGRAVGTAIYYLVVAGVPSPLHRVDAVEIVHSYGGEPVEHLLLGPAGESERVTLGTDLAAGQTPQVVVPAGWWQGFLVRAGWALLGCTVSPGFEFDGFELVSEEQVRVLAEKFPQHGDLIGELAG